MLRALLNRFRAVPADELLRYLPTEDAKVVQSITILSDDPTLLLSNPLDQLKPIHYSWLKPAIKQLPSPLQSITLSALPSANSQKLRKLLALPPNPSQESPLTPAVRDFLLNKIMPLVKPSGILPLAYLPESSLSFLVKLDKQHLVGLIGFLGLYDLAEGIRHIIDKNFLQKLYRCLTHHQKQFLRQCLHQQDKVVTARLEMSLWDGTCAKLDTMLQHRGLLRLGRALCGQNYDLIWHISHILDTGRGEILMHYFSPEVNPKVTPRLIQQVTAVMNFLNPKAPSDK